LTSGRKTRALGTGSIHFEITIGNNRILVNQLTAQSQSASMACYGACLKWMLPELSFSDRWSRGAKLWERDWKVLCSMRLRRTEVRCVCVCGSRETNHQGGILPEGRILAGPTQISRSRLKQSRISALVPHIYVLGCFVNFFGDFWVYLEIWCYFKIRI